MVKPKGGTTMAIIKRKYHTKKQQKPVIYYQAEVFIKGVRVAVKNFSTRREAILWHEEKRHKLTFSSSSLNAQMTFKICVERFLKEAKTRMLKSTYQRYEYQTMYLYPSPLAKIKVSEIKGFHIVEWIGWLKNQPTKNYKQRASFIKEIKFLKTILNWYKDFLNEDFNVPITKKHKQLCFVRSTKPRRQDYFIKPENARRWVEWLKKHRNNPVYWRLASFMLLTGARISEACGLKWDALDLEQDLARVVRRVRWDYTTKIPVLEEVTKTSQSSRLLVLPKKLQEILLEIKKETMSDLVFTDSKGELLRYNAVQSAFNAGFTALKLPWRSTHICRHTYATMALMGTKNLSAVQASLGHTQQTMTQRYAKAVALLSSDIGEKTSAIFFQSAKK